LSKSGGFRDYLREDHRQNFLEFCFLERMFLPIESCPYKTEIVPKKVTNVFSFGNIYDLKNEVSLNG
jgi:hypothetical protein